MNKIRKMMVMLMVFTIVSMTIPSALASNVASPYQVTISFIVPSDTTFTVTLAGVESAIDFKPSNKTVSDVQPDSQVALSSTPIARITNGGNVNLDFSVNLTATKPSWVTMYAGSANSKGSAQTFDTTSVTEAGWQNIAPEAMADVYLWADFSNAAGGTTTRTFQINGAQ